MTTDPAPYALHASLGYQATLFSRVTERRFEALLAPIGLTRLSWCVLLATAQEGLKYPSEIATFIGIDRTATSRALRQMESRGLIARKNGEKDGRTTEVIPTAKGQVALVKGNHAARTNAARFDQKLSRYQRDMLVGLIQKLMQGESRDVAGL